MAIKVILHLFRGYGFPLGGVRRGVFCTLGREPASVKHFFGHGRMPSALPVADRS